MRTGARIRKSAGWRRQCGRYLALPPAPVGPLDAFWARLEVAAPTGRVLVGLDFPIGLPAAYAERAGIGNFLEALDRFDGDFYEVARTPEEISLTRPFYPDRPGRRRRRQLLDGLGLESWERLHRRCDRATASRPAACPMFWTLGGNQVGKAAIAGWRDLLAPARRNRVDVAIWPFDGSLAALLRTHRFVVAETYPGEVYGHLGLALRAHGGKRQQAARAANADRLLEWAKRWRIAVAPALAADIVCGFGPDPGADDRFDAVVGVFGMLNVLRGARPSGEPDDPVVRRIEGWILGQASAPDAGDAGGNNRPQGRAAIVPGGLGRVRPRHRRLSLWETFVAGLCYQFTMPKQPEIDLAAGAARLRARREELLRLTAEHEDESAPVELDQTRVGRLSRMDALQSQAMAAEVERRREAELARIQTALERIDQGEYGYCVACGEPIAPKRLELDPATPTCVSCAERSG